ncbi:ABC transporter ATP-binding protein [Thiohalorhabdus denitrificans]|uniref:ABC-2 type transport system ATP-binding protein n=1 Tax=Thiohalorhabdus denitrificans TaxID=381306 RepID=A0A1G5HPR7_9GAMM|nr:ABC transporter ATP-binding protein [Thiohalorhabdus denitrificans]SCY65300.1 ABC-2 type transport system ATP-binding protein [Thiohalorhabdus denitrificans]
MHDTDHTGPVAEERPAKPSGSAAGPGDREAPPAIAVSRLSKTYDSGFQALRGIDLEVSRGEIFGLLGPNGAGKTTLISIICGLVNATSGRVRVDGYDNVADYRAVRSRVGLVPQELATESFETVWDTVRFSRGLFGRPPDAAHLEKVLRDLALWEKRDSKIMSLSGGMKRRLLIAKALAHEPRILFLDEPTAGVDVDLRHDMWEVVRVLRESGVTVVLTTHYIEEAEEMADRVGVINNGELVVVEEKAELMRKLGGKRLTLHLREPLAEIPPGLEHRRLELGADGFELTYTYDADGREEGVAELLTELGEAGIHFADLHTEQRSLEDIFVSLVREGR